MRNAESRDSPLKNNFGFVLDTQSRQRGRKLFPERSYGMKG